MPSPKPYDTTINCGPENPFTLIKRGPVKIGLQYLDVTSPDSDVFAVVRVGRRRQRTAFTQPLDHATLIREVLEILGFEPEVELEALQMDQDYD